MIAEAFKIPLSPEAAAKNQAKFAAKHLSLFFLKMCCQKNVRIKELYQRENIAEVMCIEIIVYHSYRGRIEEFGKGALVWYTG